MTNLSEIVRELREAADKHVERLTHIKDGPFENCYWPGPTMRKAADALERASNACLTLAKNHGFATGHGDTVADMIAEFDGQIAERERRSSAEIAGWREVEAEIGRIVGHSQFASWPVSHSVTLRIAELSEATAGAIEEMQTQIRLAEASDYKLIAAEAKLAEIDSLLSSGERSTVNPQSAFEHWGELNQLLVQVRGIARGAKQQREPS